MSINSTIASMSVHEILTSKCKVVATWYADPSDFYVMADFVYVSEALNEVLVPDNIDGGHIYTLEIYIPDEIEVVVDPYDLECFLTEKGCSIFQ